jgi:hypothetical protein
MSAAKQGKRKGRTLVTNERGRPEWVHDTDPRAKSCSPWAGLQGEAAKRPQAPGPTDEAAAEAAKIVAAFRATPRGSAGLPSTTTAQRTR